MSIPYSLADHIFMTSPDMSYFYVLDNTDPANPTVAEALALGKQGYILTLSYGLDNRRREFLVVDNSNTIDDPSLERVILGSVSIVQQDFSSGQANHQMRSWFNGAAVKNGNRVLTVAGIGISDIVAADPLKIFLIDAPFVSITDDQNVQRNVLAVQIEANQPTATGFSNTNNSVWTISILLQ
ncbi:MAG: hypothetical protein U0176_22025 [Bacteroidia bacterium]